MLAPLALLLAMLAQAPDAAPIRLHPENPHYFQFRGKPTILVTSGEHYGAVLNRDFDFLPYLDELAARGFNLTRTFAGTYREVPGSFRIERNTLAPAPGRFVSPWARVSKDGEPDRFDLDRFDPAHVERLTAFLAEAQKRGIVVELVLFCPLYDEALWTVNPMNARNNVNGVGAMPREEVYTLKHPELLRRQLAVVRHIVTAVNAFPNLTFEICNEPYIGGVTLDWQGRIAAAIVEAESALPNKHLIAQNIANNKAKVDRPVHPEVDILNFHYADPAAAIENYGLDLALGDDETGFAGVEDRPYRTEAWRFLLSGGSVFSHLDYSFTTDAEDGSAKIVPPTPGGGGPGLRSQFAFLKRTVEGMDFLRMRPMPRVLPGGVKGAALVEPGRQALVYLAARPGDTVEIALPRGEYKGAFLDPLTGKELGPIAVAGGKQTITLPAFAEDVAIRLTGDAPAPAVTVATTALADTAPEPAAPRLRVSDNRRFLARDDGDGTPFFYLGDTAWELFHRTTREEAALYLDDRAKKGFNVIQAVVLAELDGLHAPNSYGHRPLIDDDPSRPNEEYFRHVDWVVAQANRRGMLVGMLPTWGDKVNRKWGVGPEVFTPENARVYGEFLGRRYRDDQILWILGGDRPIENDTHREIWDAMAAGIRAGDGGRHLITYHPMGGSSSADKLADATWIDFHMIQSGHGARDIDNGEAIARDYGRRPTRPVLDGEPRYENHPIDWKPANGWFDAHDVRKASYGSVFAGGCGVTYGCHDIWQMWQPPREPISGARTPWKESLAQPGSGQMVHLKNLLLSRPYFGRVPDQSLVAAGQGQGGDHVRACRDADGRFALVYVPSGKPVTIDLGKLSGGELLAHWYDPRTGEAHDAGRFPREGRRAFTPPAGGPDWVLVLDDAAIDFPPPGRPR
jgi:hypothetical protein